ncbi:MAG: hypothetical protein K2N51_19555 [Lachnospiraceae bacterium]|nr:hypothetical protein [Lachnospiraceae bacterium]
MNFLEFCNLITVFFSSEDSILSKLDKVYMSTTFNNKTDWKPFAEDLKKKCTKFMGD